MCVGEIRIQLQGHPVGLHGLRVGLRVRVELAASFEEVASRLVGRLGGRSCLRSGGDRGHTGRLTDALQQHVVQQQLPVGLHQAAVVLHDHPKRALAPGSQRGQWIPELGKTLAQDLDAATDSTQRDPTLEQGKHGLDPNQVAEVVVSSLARSQGLGASRAGSRNGEPGSFPIAQPGWSNLQNACSVVQAVGIHRPEFYTSVPGCGTGPHSRAALAGLFAATAENDLHGIATDGDWKSRLDSSSAGFLWLVPGLDFKSSGERVATFSAGSIPVPRRQL